ncbi:MAG: hypothetical protein H6868_04210 [Rhodospirillales bacterium]|nr:hypothetical protein [Rhodospirillales bacterium]
MKRNKTTFQSGFQKTALVFAVLVFVVVVIPASTAWACCGCIDAAHEATRGTPPGARGASGPRGPAVGAANSISKQHEKTRHHVTKEFQKHQIWLMDDFFREYVLIALMRMTEQMTAVAMHQMLAVGMFLDAKHQLETQLIFQDLVSQAHKDYHSSMGMCVIGTNVRSIAAADRNAELTTHVLSQRALDRHLGNADVGAAVGPIQDRKGRLEQFIAHYCDVKDDDGGLLRLCTASAPAKSVNKDVNYARTVGYPRTLEIDFSDNVLTDDERDVFALGSNLYGHDVFSRISRDALGVYENQPVYMDVRAITAKRSVAENSFNAIVGMKARGTLGSEDTAQYMYEIMEQLQGITAGEAEVMIGKRPSYYAQIELLAQKLYQDPEFYTNLYDKPTNVLRKDVSMQAINLMLDRDLYNSELRSEAMMAVLLEMELTKYQDTIKNRIANISDRNKEN